eukprot:9641814-Alexandrium_andersonii.AAC.1
MDARGRELADDGGGWACMCCNCQVSLIIMCEICTGRVEDVMVRPDRCMDGTVLKAEEVVEL